MFFLHIFWQWVSLVDMQIQNVWTSQKHVLYIIFLICDTFEIITVYSPPKKILTFLVISSGGHIGFYGIKVFFI